MFAISYIYMMACVSRGDQILGVLPIASRKKG
jgi:hypothetical protein